MLDTKPATVEDVQQLIQSGLKSHGGKVPQRSTLRHYVLFRQQNTKSQNGFAFNLEDVIRLDRNENACWLLCSDLDNDKFRFYVVPHRVGRQLVQEEVFICRPASSRNNPARFKAGVTTVTVPNGSESLQLRSWRVEIREYRNRVDLFNELVLPQWHLLDESDSQMLEYKTCPRCGLEKLPDYGTERHDLQCRNGACGLLWCGEFWNDHPSESRTRERKRLPSRPGWWVFHSTMGWEVWDGTPLNR